MEFTLTIRERYTLMDLLPTKGNSSQLTRCQELRDALVSTDDEKKDFGLKDLKDQDGYPTGAVRLPPESGKTGRKIPVGQHVFDTIVVIFKKLNDSSTLDAQQLSLYQKFVDPGPEKPADKGKTPDQPKET